MNIGEWLRNAATALSESGCPDPEIDARWIMEDTLNMNRAEIIFQSDRTVNPDQLEKLNMLLRRRINGEPVQYILESTYFMGMKFYVDNHVLIPRQDTETLVEAATVALRDMSCPSVLDMCTGSGAIGLSLKTLIPAAKVTLTDISREALEVAKKNASLLSVDVVFKHGDLYKAIGRETFDCIISNPPYISRENMSKLQREVCFEPEIALDGGLDGLDFYRRIAENVAQHLNPGGRIFLEVGVGEAMDVLNLIRNNLKCAESGVINDLNGIERVVWARSV